MARSGRLRRPGRGLKHEDQSNPKTGPGTTLVGGRFRLIVDGWATFDPGTCAPPRRTLDDAVSTSTIRLKRASTIAEMRTKAKDASKTADDGLPLHSFRTLLKDLATLTYNIARTAANPRTLIVITSRPTPIQAKAFELLRLSPNCSQ